MGEPYAVLSSDLNVLDVTSDKDDVTSDRNLFLFPNIIPRDVEVQSVLNIEDMSFNAFAERSGQGLYCEILTMHCEISTI